MKIQHIKFDTKKILGQSQGPTIERGLVTQGKGLEVRARPSRQSARPSSTLEREVFIDNPLVRIHFIIVMIRWTGLAPWKFEFPFPGSLTSTFLPLRYLALGFGSGFWV